MRIALPKDLELELEASLGLGPCQLGHLPHLRIEVGVILTCARGR